MFTRIFVTLFSIASLVGCASPAVKEFQGPDGSKVKTVKCTSDPQKCFELASQSCPNGGTYRVLSSESHAGGMLADWIPGPVTWYGMTYACGASDGKLPEFKHQGQRYTPPQYTPPAPAQKSRSTTTTCTPMGNGMTCNTY